MSRMLSALFVILALSSAGLAQEEDRSGLRASVLYGYNLKGWEKPADHDIIFGFGYVLQPGFGIDLEIGTHGGWHWNSKCDCYTSYSANGSYYFPRFSRAKELSKFEPFLTAGYEYMSPNLLGSGRSPHLFNIGGGVNYWFNDRAAIRAEFREHLSFSGESRHFSELRMGVTVLLFR